MRSYVNKIPLPERAVRRILDTIKPYRYERLHGAFTVLEHDPEPVVGATLERYLAWLRGDVPDEPDR